MFPISENNSKLRLPETGLKSISCFYDNPGYFLIEIEKEIFLITYC